MNPTVSLLSKMEEHLLLAGITSKKIESFKKWLTKQKESHLHILEDLELYEYREVCEIWHLAPPEQWLMYEALELEGLREQLLLKEALKNLRSKFLEIIKNVKQNKAAKDVERKRQL